MGDPDDEPLPELINLVRARTPARLLVGRAGSSYRTETFLDLREDHAAARDAVRSEMDLDRDFGPDWIERWKLLEVRSQVQGKAEYLLRPDLGRRLDADSSELIRRSCPGGGDLQIAIGDGLSPAAVAAQVPTLLPLLDQGARALGWTVGRPFAIRYCRVGILNDIGDLLGPSVVVLLIGERPGLATSESLSAYLAYRPKCGQTDAHRNLISNIHARGTSPEEAAGRILGLASQMIRRQISGVQIKELREPQDGLPGVAPGE
jgi:ethanolamine ammonia-lyase small subunit